MENIEDTKGNFKFKNDDSDICNFLGLLIEYSCAA